MTQLRLLPLPGFCDRLNLDIDPTLLSTFDAEGKAFIVVDVLKSNSFFVKAFKENSGGVDVDIDSIKTIIGVESTRPY